MHSPQRVGRTTRSRTITIRRIAIVVLPALFVVMPLAADVTVAQPAQITVKGGESIKSLLDVGANLCGPGLGVVSAKCAPHNARGDGVSDDGPAIQSLLDAQAAASLKSPVYLPCGTYVINKPLRMKAGTMQLWGGGDRCTIVTPAFTYGPVFVSYPSSTYATLASRLGPALARGAGGSFNLSASKWLNLRDSPTLNLEGLGAFTVELFYKPISQTGTDAIISSTGNRFGAEAPVTQGSAFWLMTFGGHFHANIKTTGGQSSCRITGRTTPSNGTVYHVAMTWDGATLRLFVNGTREASGKCTGTIVQRAWEDVILGPQIGQWPEGTLSQLPATASVDSARVSSVARYTSNFTAPTAKLSSDVHTLMLLNFDNQYDAFTVGNTKDGDAHLFLRDTASTSIGGNTDVVVKDIHFQGGVAHPAVILTYAVKSRLENVRATSNVFGIYCWNNCFESRWVRPHITIGGTGKNAGRFALANSVQGGVFEIDYPFLGGGAVQLANYGGSILLIRPWLQTEANTATAILVVGSDDGDFTAIDPIVNTEAGDIPMTEAMILSHVGPVNVVGGVIETFNSAPMARIDAGSTYVFSGTKVADRSPIPATSIFTITNAPTRPIVLLGTSQTVPTVAWSDTANTTILIDRYTTVRTTLTYGSSIAIDASKGNWFVVTLTDGRAHTFAAPTNPAVGQRMTLTVRNTFGTIATARFDPVFKTAVYVPPANGCSTSGDFEYDGTNWVQITPWVACVPN